MGSKRCTGCHQEKDEALFVMDRVRQRRKARCLACTSAASKAWRKARLGYERARYQATKTQTRERHLVRKYGVALADYERMLAAQDRVCAICGVAEETQHNKVFHVDHCHATGRVRGILCRGCNHVLGHLKDDAGKLRKAITYLEIPQIPELIGRAIMQAEARHAA